MPDAPDVIYDSPASEPDDDFWLEQGKKMAAESLASVREAAKAFMIGVEVILAIYLGILGFAHVVPANGTLFVQILFALPLVCWLATLYFCIGVMMTSRIDVYLHAPADVREKSEAILQEKQSLLTKAYGFLAAGLLIAVALLIYRMGL